MKTYKSKKEELQLIKESANTNDLLNKPTLTAKEKKKINTDIKYVNRRLIDLKNAQREYLKEKTK